jgi:hypothetical protein
MMEGVTHSREISPSPPVTFPVYGLDASWTGSRWLDGFGDRIGDEVRWVRGLLHALVNDADANSREYAQWSPVSWRLDGSQAPARSRRFAGGWAACSDSADGVYLAAAGLGIDPDGLALTALSDGRAYSFDLDRPLHPGIIAASSAARAGGERLPPLRPDWHADQLRLMPG